ncbi:cyanidin 3-O-galactoside 2''-O-xylosyltransferase FGGT1-like isoform X2 [Diospyros lotus]|nr:cyanidin 3-O-galactoside 2''-O-xylosyltransferase FGGT1-like isoform X2 [Diospyros lotus]XP_052208661.1 cyanidin 3-O-galactoside 2''-O-xylosyltransferase FGGT1-like isoform X2 [Diospyros lotus]XP_052208663.1 cyanidin 3-O-galactoside 2''-O-xylosyltransferase FGGT1-like isoform X2 [Diospyros lotus]XP_052208664.1 cyanidin 3-O-galactoside 2''-O-xylosyltransferase FGGT1-like isoform X2 [Diospyros lotus]
MELSSGSQREPHARTLHIAMYPWLAVGHIIPFLETSNKLATKGHKVSFLIPPRTRSKLAHFNRHPHLITFVPITLPPVEGLPLGAETTADLPSSLGTLLMDSMDRTQPQIEAILNRLKLDVVFFDFTHWLPALARQLGIKSVFYSVVNPSTIAYALSPARRLPGKELAGVDMAQPPEGYPLSAMKLHAHEARAFEARRKRKFGGDMLFYDSLYASLCQCDALGFSTCGEIEGPFCDYLGSQYEKPVLLSGLFVNEPPSSSSLDERWGIWLRKFKAGSVVYCALGTECSLTEDNFQELVMGLELTGLPFLAVLRPPVGSESVEEALPESFNERIQDRGVVYGGWVHQQLILVHPSIGCFLTHCGSSSLREGFVSHCQLVLLPHKGDQMINARLASLTLRVGVEVERGEEDGSFTRDSVCGAVRSVMDEDSEVGQEVRGKHAKLRELLLSKDFDAFYTQTFSEKLADICLHE